MEVWGGGGGGGKRGEEEGGGGGGGGGGAERRHAECQRGLMVGERSYYNAEHHLRIISRQGLWQYELLQMSHASQLTIRLSPN